MYRKCPYCGAALDPGEKCDCNEKAAPDVEDPEAAQVKTTKNNITENKTIVKE
jgi:hypothetical protein